VPRSIRGYGHVKLASLAIARARERELLSRFDPVRWPKPEGASVAGQFKGIAITSGG
jgi:indolepyruvate ferredoxin oxidoreductase